MLAPQWALTAGIVVSFYFSNKSKIQTTAKIWGTKTLQLSVILLGSSLNFRSVLREGATGSLITLVSLITVFGLGLLGIKALKLDKKLGLLITMGTAICGGSAIAALAPVIAADSVIITISIAIIFLLNALAVFIFPFLGTTLNLSQADFGLWAALAIHDTSSVVAASSVYGQEAMSIATTVKLTRALWIIPITALFAIVYKRRDKKIPFPWFVMGFLTMSLFFTFTESLNKYKYIFLFLSKSGFSLTLFLIGLTFDFKKMKDIGLRPLLFAVGLWFIISLLSLIYILNFT
jgi:uncharacterized integral membrane protein (TIGR00698 family)